MAVSPQPDNGKVTLAVLSTKLDTLTEEVRSIRRSQDATQAWCITSQERWRQHEKDHEDISRKNTIGDWVAYIGAALAAVIGRAN